MFTQGFKRLRYALLAIGAVGLVFVLVTTGLQLAARQVEHSGVAYPYKQEDWLRYLLPSMWQPDDKPLILLAGPSTVRENLLFEEFAAAFPGHRVLQGGISSGTLGDMMAGLEYVERAYGADALPKVVVLGLSPRFIAEIPHRERPFGMGLDKYSPYLRTRAGDADGFGLVRKGRWEGAKSYARFMILKQHERYVTAAEWYVAQIVGPRLSDRLRSTPLMDSGLGRLLFTSGRVRDIGIHRFALELASPYKYRSASNPFGNINVLLDSSDVWREVFQWNPDHDAAVVTARVTALKEYARQHDIQLFVINLPEGSLNRVRTRPEYADRYLALIASAFQPLPVLNLRCLLEDNEFLDAEHARLRGARRITVASIGYVRDLAAMRASESAQPALLQDILRKWQAANCPEAPTKENDNISPADRGRSARAGLAGTAATGP